MKKETTRTKITRVLFELLSKKELNEISVTEITQITGVARLTFYRNFLDKEDVIVKNFNEIFQKIIDELQDQDKDIAFEKILEKFLRAWHHQQKFNQVILERNLAHVIQAPFNQGVEFILRRYKPQRTYDKFELMFIEAGLLATLLNWEKNPENYSIERMAKLVLYYTQ